MTKDIDDSKTNDLFQTLATAIATTQGKEVNVFTSPPKARTNNGFVMLFYEAVSDLIFSGVMGLTEIKVLLGFCKVAEYGNCISINQTKMAELLGMQKSNLSVSIKKLIKNGVLIKTDLGLFFNPSLIVKGRLDKVSDDLWEEAFLTTGITSPLKKVSKKQAKQQQISFLEQEQAFLDNSNTTADE